METDLERIARLMSKYHRLVAEARENKDIIRIQRLKMMLNSDYSLSFVERS